MKKHLIRSLMVSVILVCLPGTGFGESLLLGVKGGLVFPGTFYVTPPGWNFGTKLGVLVGLKADVMLAKKFSMGFFLQRAVTKVEERSGSATADTIGMTLKAHFGRPGGVKVRPGLAVGYQILSHEMFPKTVTGLDVGGLVEIAVPISRRAAVDIDLGFIFQPAGGNADVDLTFGPIFYLTVGFEFGV